MFWPFTQMSRVATSLRSISFFQQTKTFNKTMTSSFLNKIIFGFAAICLLSSLYLQRLAAQCNPSFVNSNPIILPLCATGNCNTVVVSIQVNNPNSSCSSLGTTAPEWTVVNNGTNAASGIEIVSTSTSGTNPVIHACTLRSKATNAGGNAMKGRLRARWQGVCGGGAEFVRSIDIFKQYTEANGPNNGRLDELSGGAGGDANHFRIQSSGACVTPGKQMVFSVPPLATNPPTDEIGQDNYFWAFPDWQGQPGFSIRYASGDNSAITVQAPSALDVVEPRVWVKVGNANTPNPPSTGNFHSQLILTREASDIRIITTQTGLGACIRQTPSGPLAKEATAIISANLSTNSNNFLTLSAATVDGSPLNYPDGNYTWTFQENAFQQLPDPLYGNTIDNKRPRILLRPLPGAQGLQEHRITLSLDKGQCGADFAALTVYRDFSLAGAPAYNRITPAPDNTCYIPGRSYSFAITNPPAGQYTWSFTGGWQITQGQGTSAVTVVAGTASPNITVTAAIPAEAIGNCTGRITQLSASGYNVANDNNLDFVINRTNRNLTIQNSNGGEWLPNTCDASQFLYTWQFRGERSTNNGTTWTAFGSWNADGGTWFPAINPNTGQIANGAPIFTGPAIPNTPSNTFALGRYRGLQTAGAPPTAQFRLTVRHNPDALCPNYTCFFGERIFNLADGTYMPTPGGGSEPRNLSDLPMQAVNGITVYPNPNGGDFTVAVDNPATDAQIILRNSQGKEVHRLNHVEPHQLLQLKHLPKGIYLLEYSGGADRMSGKIVID
jgi:hypothetical protein